MSKKDVYKTVKKQSQSLLIEKKSKFIANVKPVDNEDDALAFLNEMRLKYSDATHNVYAYVIDENNIFRYSDDGEPHGTAGRGPYPKGEIARQQKVADDADAEGAKIGKGRPEVVETPHQHDVNGVIDRRGDASHHGEAHERTLIEPPEHHRYPTHRIRGIRGWSKTDSRGLSATPAAG